MENGYNGNVSADSLLWARGAGIGGGFGGYNYGQGSFAGPSSNAVRINRNAAVAEANDRCTKETLGLGLDRLSDQNREGRFNAAITSLRDGQFQLELRTNDQARATDRTLNDMRLESCKCCEEAKLVNCQTESRLAQRMEAIEAGRVRDENAKLQARVNQLEIFREGGFGCGGGVTVCPPPCPCPPSAG